MFQLSRVHDELRHSRENEEISSSVKEELERSVMDPLLRETDRRGGERGEGVRGGGGEREGREKGEEKERD